MAIFTVLVVLVLFLTALSVVGDLFVLLVLLAGAVILGFALGEAVKVASTSLSRRQELAFRRIELERIRAQAHSANRQLTSSYVSSQFKGLGAADLAARLEKTVPNLTAEQQLAIRSQAREYLGSL